MTWYRKTPALSGNVEHLHSLVAEVTPEILEAINASWDEPEDAEHTVSYGDLAQAATQAQYEHGRR